MWFIVPRNTQYRSSPGNLLWNCSGGSVERRTIRIPPAGATMAAFCRKPLRGSLEASPYRGEPRRLALRHGPETPRHVSGETPDTAGADARAPQHTATCCGRKELCRVSSHFVVFVCFCSTFFRISGAFS